LEKAAVLKSISQFKIPAGFIGPLLITGLVLAAHISFGVLDGWEKFAVALVAAMATEAVFHKIVTGKWRNVSSAYISGNSAGILVRSPMIWPFALCAAISIASKYVFRFRGTHIWNPTNFGIVIMLLIASDSMAVLSIQWGSNMWAMLAIWIVGLAVISKVKLFHVCAVYVVSFVGFAWLRSVYTGDLFLAEVAPLTGPMYQLFVLFMITDPKTTVSTKKGRMIVAFLIAAVEMVFRLGEAVYAPFYALFIVGPIALIAEKLWEDWKSKPSLNSQDSTLVDAQ
jgi:Na+-translocating ferredoxin:NAD+ oxidoreductase RnfD subunit